MVILVKLQVEAWNFTKINNPPWCFSRFLNCTNGIKSRNAPHIFPNHLWSTVEIFWKILMLTLPALCISESCIKIQINLNFYFHTSLWCLKRFYEQWYTSRFLERMVIIAHNSINALIKYVYVCIWIFFSKNEQSGVSWHRFDCQWRPETLIDRLKTSAWSYFQPVVTVENFFWKWNYNGNIFSL